MRAWRRRLRQGVQKFSKATFDSSAWDSFSGLVSYFQGDLSDPESFKQLHAYLKKLEKGPAWPPLYLAISPTLLSRHYEPGNSGMASQQAECATSSWRSVRRATWNRLRH